MTDEKVFYAEGDDPKMVAAYAQAQATFKYFWRELSWENRRIIPALNLACVKVACRQEDEENDTPIVEHMWINEIEFDGLVVKGILLNSPTKITNFSAGDEIEVLVGQISDWLFTIEEQSATKGLAKFFPKKSAIKSYGGFTIQALRSQMTNKERIAHDKSWGIDFGDYNEILWVEGQKENPDNLIEHPNSKAMKEKLRDFLIGNPDELLAPDDEGYTLLHRESIAGNLSSVLVLLELGANKSAKTKEGYIALDFAKKLNWTHIIPALET